MTTDEDPVTAEYDVFITPAQEQQIQLLQYLNRPRERPYNQSSLARPGNVRLKPQTGFLELDIDMHTSINFNRYQSLKWGDALQTARTLQNDSATYGPATGFGASRSRGGNRNQLKDKVERDLQIGNDLRDFDNAVSQHKTLSSQTLGGKINRLDAPSDLAHPVYFVGAFRGKELHLTRVDGTVQMRPQFHHIDAEEQRNRTAASRAAAAAETDANRAQAAPRAIQIAYKDLNEEKDKDAPERNMRKLLQAAEEEEWAHLQYVDEDEEQAFDTFSNSMFLSNPYAAPALKSKWSEKRYLDEINPGKHTSQARRKKRIRKKDTTIEIDAAEESNDEHD